MKYTLKDLIDVEQFQMLQDRLNDIYSFPSAMIDNEGNILTASAWQDVCTKYHRVNKECEKECIKSDQYIKDHLSEAGPSVSYCCPHGLIENVAPIIIDGIHYGNFFTGQYFLEQPDIDYFRAQAKLYGFDEKSYIEAVKKVPIWSQEQQKNYLFFIKGFIEIILGIGLKNLKEIENQKKIQLGEEHYRTMLQTTMDGYWLADVKGNIIQVNEVYCRMCGYSEKEILTMTISDFEVNETFQNTASHIEKIIFRGEDRFESRHRRKDGSTFDVEVNVQYRAIEGGRFVVFLKDISERKRAEMRLNENQQFLTEIIENNGALIYAKNRDGRYELVNKKWETAIGLKREFVIGKTDVEIFPEKIGTKIRTTDLRIMEHGNVEEIEEHIEDESVEKYFLTIKFPLRDNKNEIRGVCGIATDISERIRTEMELRNRTRELSALLKSSQSLSETLDIQTVLQTTTDSIVEMMDLQSAAIYLKDGEMLYLGATSPALPPNFPEELRRAHLADHPHIQNSLISGMPVFLPDTTMANLTPAEKAVSVQRGLSSILYLPLLVKEQSIGTLIVAKQGEPRVLTVSEIDLCRTLASLAALAVENSKLYEQARMEISERKTAELLLAQEKERLSVTLRSIGDGVITTNVDGNVMMLNKAAEDLTGWKTEEAAGRPLSEVFIIINEQTRELCENPVHKVLRTGTIIELENHTSLISKNGKEIIIADSAAPIRDKESRITGVVLVFRDMTEKQKLNVSLQRAQKMESVALLAGGIAHDFNNLLGGVFGYLEMAKGNLAINNLESLSSNLNKALKVYDRAKGLTQQLLTFSKGGAPIRKTQHLAPIITHSTNFALSGSNVTAKITIEEDLWLCDCDENQIGQVLDNIVINAKQAMPMGGNIFVNAEKVTNLPGHPGNFVRISIKDFGIGMPAEILLKIFDPFFSTKETGHGLGLATVFSIIKHHDGWIDVESKPLIGSTFQVFIPASQKSTNGVMALNTIEHKGTGSVLLMDDEEFMLEVVGQMLEEMGYTVVSVKDGKDAITHFMKAEKSDHPFVACILDLTIPGGIGGKETAAAIRDINPNSIIIASSGYSEDIIISTPTQHKFTDKIIKPYRKNELSDLLTRVLKK